MKLRYKKRVQCKKCNHQWIPRKLDVRVCPKCKSAWWDIEKKVGTTNE